MRLHGKPVLSFNLPPSAPAKLEALRASFDDVALRYSALEGELDDAMAAVDAAREKDAEVNAEAFLAGKATPKVLDKLEREALAKAAGLRAAISAAAKAVDGAGNALARAVPSAKADWLASLAEREAEAVARYASAMADAQAALAEIVPLRGASEYLERFSVGDVLTGQDRHGWHMKGRRALVEGDQFGPLSGDQDATELLALAAKAVKKIEPPQPRTHGPARVNG